LGKLTIADTSVGDFNVSVVFLESVFGFNTIASAFKGRSDDESTSYFEPTTQEFGWFNSLASFSGVAAQRSSSGGSKSKSSSSEEFHCNEWQVHASIYIEIGKMIKRRDSNCTIGSCGSHFRPVLSMPVSARETLWGFKSERS
jgi:hypothetical protein